MIDGKFYKFGKNRLIEVSLKLFHYFGMWPNKDSTIVYSIVGYIFQTLTSFAWTLAKSIESVMLKKKSDLILFVPSTIYAFFNIYRAFLIMWKHKTINTNLNIVSDLLLTENEYETVQKRINFFNRISLAHITSLSLGLVSACINPIISHGNDLPVPIWLPYNDWKNIRQDYIYALLFSYAGIAPVTIICSFTPIVVWYLICVNSIKLEVFGQRLRTLGSKDTLRNDSLNDLFHSIRRHQEIVANIRELEDIFGGVFFYQIMSSAICICSIAYLMTDASSGSSNNLMMYVGLGGIYTYEIFVLIYYANEVALASDQLTFRLYESNWIGMSMKYQKIMIIVVEQWRKPVQLVVGKVFPMRINILTSILNVAYSILNVLRKGRQP